MMGALLSYSIESGLLMLAMYLAFRVFLSSENQHSYNRGVLLLIYAVSFAALPVIQFLQPLFLHDTSQGIALDGVAISGSNVIVGSKPMWGTLLIWVYMIGMTIVALKTVATWLRLIMVVRAGEKVSYHGCKLVLTDDERFAPFSWMNYIVISRADYHRDCQAITTHEMKHVACRHWIDLLVAQIVCIVNWFNPTAWLMRDELMLVHEYQADMAVIAGGSDVRDYQMLLIKKAVGARFPSLANSLNHSKLKKRITMMYKEKSGAGRKLKVLALVPMLALALLVSAVPSVRAAVSTISNSGVSAGEGSENAGKDKTSVKVFKVTNVNNYAGKTTVTIKGTGLGDMLTVSGGTFTSCGKTYKATSLQCNMSNGEATVKVEFPFMSEFDKCSMTLNVNGDDIPFDLENFFNKADTTVLVCNGQQSSSKSPIVITSSSSSITDNMIIYIDGERVSHQEMANIPTEKIEKIIVDKKKNEIRITLNKK